jgi:hypothetical protein
VLCALRAGLYVCILHLQAHFAAHRLAPVRHVDPCLEALGVNCAHRPCANETRLRGVLCSVKARLRGAVNGTSHVVRLCRVTAPIVPRIPSRVSARQGCSRPRHPRRVHTNAHAKSAMVEAVAHRHSRTGAACGAWAPRACRSGTRPSAHSRRSQHACTYAVHRRATCNVQHASWNSAA